MCHTESCVFIGVLEMFLILTSVCVALKIVCLELFYFWKKLKPNAADSIQ